MRIIKHKTNIDFIGKRRPAFFISTMVNLAILVGIAIWGFDLGVDFAGGTLVELKFNQPLTAEVVRERAKPLGEAHVQRVGSEEDNTFLISGAFSADFRVFQVSVTLGNSPTTGLIIDNGKFQLKAARFELDNATLGPVTLKQLAVQWDEPSPGDFDIAVAGKVLLPGGWAGADDGSDLEMGMAVRVGFEDVDDEVTVLRWERAQ